MSPQPQPYSIKGKKKNKASLLLQEQLGFFPDAELATAIQAQENDPVLWTMNARRLKGLPYVFDVERKIRAIEAEVKGRANALPTPEDLRSLKVLNLRHRPFLMQPLRDLHPHKVYIKGRQVGISELAITEALYFLDVYKGTKWVYTFPRLQQLSDFSNTRIKEALTETPYMRKLLTGADQVGQKGIGSSHLLLRSAWESNLGEGIDADGVTLDEKDRMKPGIDIAFRESLSSSRFGFLREVSTPTLPGQGVDATFGLSNQNYWFVKCLKCGERQMVDYPDNIVQVKEIAMGAKELVPGTYEYQCRKFSCRGPLDRYSGVWVEKYPERKNIHGYHLPQTICPWIDATTIMQKKLDYKFIQLWENYVLGITSKGEQILLNDQDFKSCTSNYAPVQSRSATWEKITVGIDWGNRSWIVVLGKNRNGRTYLLWSQFVDDDPTNELMSVNQMIPIIKPFDPDIIVADAGYGKDRNQRLARMFPGRFFSCWYNPSEKGGRTFQPQWSENQGKLLVDRTATIKTACLNIRERGIGFPPEGVLPIMALLKKHAKALAPIKEVDDDGEMYEVIKSTGDDHLMHCLCYAGLGMDKVTGDSSFSFSFMGI